MDKEVENNIRIIKEGIERYRRALTEISNPAHWPTQYPSGSESLLDYKARVLKWAQENARRALNGWER